MTTWLLALDTSTPRTALAVGHIDAATGSAHAVAEATHDDRGRPASAELATRISALLAAAGVAPRELGAIACGLGPGMFTGSRVALATAKGLALGLGCPLFGLSTLAIVAGAERVRGSVLALLDARRGDVYAAAFQLGDAGPERLSEDRCCPLEQVLAELPPAFVAEARAVGPGVAVASALPSELLARSLAVPGADAPGLWAAAARAALHEAPVDVATVDAVYLRASYAELGLNTPKRPPYRSPFV
ncbi:tRNA (adenosine(37)-N6)-threonylcarbamoyltransferase complex dimerization subunit type 1 TsaB [Nannocystis bainbridge]|uniref:tRNA (Adenosine(37)-N6)-threonylcarbamoyltransferase complex dimerization subunit type 1 TsaB n=1 Tax=Nannocystis bainbridge TaxID=2995303 RepID=A0ABT5DPB7_9BACT|nr:tRNA (adenosine(37)-N6)-threonylcarbamoyltransferase complex dimerization subunit type 1 TsaB [Nannocystis bainbridge]MDC0715429.1 tRNA (adenosine(37)-N6)-threonylcarbamoyltransferase complex dimerization subunit type 1 TsaB [Nannocystis bainbridge]